VDLVKQLWRDATHLAQEASPTYNHVVDDPGIGSGGLCMLMEAILAS
jgi:hypothetical protein